jgi:hypothetical protein
MLEYWSDGVLGENRIEAYNLCFRAFPDMILCSMNVIGQKNKFRVVCANHFDEPYMPGNAFPTTPILQHSSTPLV